MTTINNLTKHDFKVGDLVVLIGGKELSDSRIFTVNFTGWYSQISVLSEAKFKDIRGYDYPKNWFRHATPAEKEAGHRIDDNTDHVTDIRNHLSPSTRVVDL